MTDLRAQEEARRNALDYAAGTIDRLRLFPDQVFVGRWDNFLFFEADRLFAPSFALIVIDLLKIEKSETFCLLNLGELEGGEDGLQGSLYMDVKTDPNAYDSMLRQGGAAKGWLFGMDRFGGASDRGGWSIYCEKGNDIAVIALRSPGAVVEYANPLSELQAEPIATLLDAGPNAKFPFSKLVDSWRYGLSRNYS